MTYGVPTYPNPEGGAGGAGLPEPSEEGQVIIAGRGSDGQLLPKWGPAPASGEVRLQDATDIASNGSPKIGANVTFTGIEPTKYALRKWSRDETDPDAVPRTLVIPASTLVFRIDGTGEEKTIEFPGLDHTSPEGEDFQDTVYYFGNRFATAVDVFNVPLRGESYVPALEWDSYGTNDVILSSSYGPITLVSGSIPEFGLVPGAVMTQMGGYTFGYQMPRSDLIDFFGLGNTDFQANYPRGGELLGLRSNYQTADLYGHSYPLQLGGPTVVTGVSRYSGPREWTLEPPAEPFQSADDIDRWLSQGTDGNLRRDENRPTYFALRSDSLLNFRIEGALADEINYAPIDSRDGGIYVTNVESPAVNSGPQYVGTTDGVTFPDVPAGTDPSRPVRAINPSATVYIELGSNVVEWQYDATRTEWKPAVRLSHVDGVVAGPIYYDDLIMFSTGTQTHPFYPEKGEVPLYGLEENLRAAFELSRPLRCAVADPGPGGVSEYHFSYYEWRWYPAVTLGDTPQS